MNTSLYLLIIGNKECRYCHKLKESIDRDYKIPVHYLDLYSRSDEGYGYNNWKNIFNLQPNENKIPLLYKFNDISYPVNNNLDTLPVETILKNAEFIGNYFDALDWLEDEFD